MLSIAIPLALLALVVALAVRHAVSVPARHADSAGPIEPSPRASAELIAMLHEPEPPAARAVGVAEAPIEQFAPGRTYSRKDINAVLGGGVRDYLPHVAGAVVAGCFNPELNPDAPDVVLPGFGKEIERWADVYARQGTAVPCFLKRSNSAWEYVGRFRVKRLSREADEIARLATAAGRAGEVSMVLELEEVVD